MSVEKNMAKINLREIDDEIKRLQDLKTFMSDPRTASLIKRVIGTNGNGAPAAQRAVQPPLPQGEDANTANAHGRGSLLDAAKTACISFGAKTFTAYDLIATMESNGFEFQDKDKAIAVNGAIRRLIEKKVVERVEQPAAGKPAKYRLLSSLPG